jgi:hypothetical protein
MRMKPILCLSMMVAIMCGGPGSTRAASNASRPSDSQEAAAREATGKLGAFAGKWESTGAFLDSKFSKAHKVTSNIDCGWSPQGNFLICEQLITEGSEKHIQLSVFSYNSKEGNYTISSMAGPGRQPFNGTLLINGSVWTYPGSFEADGKKIEIRTTNDFSVAGTEAFKTEMSEDGGAHWTTTLQGTAHKVAR